jgi:WD40 repeat protein
MDLTLHCEPDETIRSTVVSRKGTFLALTLHGKPEARIFHLYSHDDNPFEKLNLPVTGKISGMAFPPEQREVALAIEQHHCVERYALGLGRLKCLPISSPQSVTYNRDGCLLAAGSSSGKIVVWSFHNESPTELYQVNCGDGCIIQIDFGIGNQQLFALTADNRCFQIDFESSSTRFGIANNASTKRILTEDDGIASDWQCLSMAAHPWLPIVVFGGNDRFFWTYDYKLKTLWRSESETANYVRKLQFLPEAKKLAVFGDQTLEFWQLDGVVFRDRGSVGNRTELLGRGTWRPTKMVKASTAPAPGLIPVAAIPMETKAVVAWASSGRA